MPLWDLIFLGLICPDLVVFQELGFSVLIKEAAQGIGNRLIKLLLDIDWILFLYLTILAVFILVLGLFPDCRWGEFHLALHIGGNLKRKGSCKNGVILSYKFLLDHMSLQREEYYRKFHWYVAQTGSS